MNHETDLGTYAQAVGSRLRAVRIQMHLSLQMVDALSEQEFRTSVLGAYERGDRAISLPRLQRLAKLYDVPLERFLPGDRPSSRNDVLGRRAKRDARQSQERATSRTAGKKVTIDLVKLASIQGPERDVLVPYLSAIQAKRRHFAGPSITIRGEDLHMIACLVGVTPEDMSVRLDKLGLCPPPAQHESSRPRRAS